MRPISLPSHLLISYSVLRTVLGISYEEIRVRIPPDHHIYSATRPSPFPCRIWGMAALSPLGGGLAGITYNSTEYLGMEYESPQDPRL